MRWYHDHSHGRTNRNSWMGLARPVHRRGPARSARCGLPRGEPRAAARAHRRARSTTTTSSSTRSPSAADPGADAVGSGVADARQRRAAARTSSSSRRRYRLRILNAASFSPYNLGFADGPEIVQIGNESGPVPGARRARARADGPGRALRPRRRLLDVRRPARRARQRAAGADAPLALGARRRPPRPTSSSWSSACAPKRKRVTGRRARCPRSCASCPSGRRRCRRSPTARSSSARPSTPGGEHDLDDQRRALRPRRASSRGPSSARPRRGCWSTPRQQSHYIHIHAVDWKVVSRNGGVPAADEDVLKETFRLDPGETLAVGAKFTDHLGPLPHPLPHAQPRGPRDDDARSRSCAAGAGDRPPLAPARRADRGRGAARPPHARGAAPAPRTAGAGARQPAAARARGRRAVPPDAMSLLPTSPSSFASVTRRGASPPGSSSRPTPCCAMPPARLVAHGCW